MRRMGVQVKMRPLGLTVLVSLFVSACAGCGTQSADVERGRMLFIENCGQCHSLAQAGTKSHTGPDLDLAFAAARAVGQDSDTVEGVVDNQIDNPHSAYIDSSPVPMPPDIVSGQDRTDVAGYVGEWAGVPGAKPPAVPGGPGAQVFANYGCAGCHTLAAAAAGGTTGPNLDESLANEPKPMIREGIVAPDKRIVPGYAPGIMPDNFEQIIPRRELEELVDYLASSAGKG
jgi:mono/diheme cytochrome c family protein